MQYSTKTKRSLSVVIIMAMIMTIFCIPGLTGDGVLAATKADSTRNKVKTPRKIIAGKAFTISGIGHRQTALNAGTAEQGDTFFIPLMWGTMKENGSRKKTGKFITDNMLKNIMNNNRVPGKFDTWLKINKPGKYILASVFLRMEWDGENFKDITENDYVYKSQTITVLGTVKFNTNAKGVKKLTRKNKNVRNKGKYGKLPKPTKKGYEFKGWFTKKSGGTKITRKTKVKMKRATKTLYAQWEKK